MKERKIEYTVVGTIEGRGDFLITLAGSNKARAEEILKETTTDPKRRKELRLDEYNYTNIRLNEEYSDDCWWNYGTD